ncbi:hypothetical protein [Ornithinimicrobium avium]|uniref:hypothetical protein n=1 Tax=Ornithinimicrobium avium TaxID=2283195 RepID=UPI0013B36FC1|nr:hypothetical protein [Ornithinimicrobium avium]
MAHGRLAPRSRATNGVPAQGAWWRNLVAAAVLLGVLVAGVVVQRHPGTYYSTVDVMFLAPVSARNPNAVVTTSGSVVSTASVVERVLNGPDGAGVRNASSRVTLLGERRLHDEAVRLPDNGGQWAPDFDEQLLTVEVTGDDPEDVARRRDALVATVDATLRQLQDDQGVDRFNRITTRLSPAAPTVTYHEGNRKRAFAMLVLMATVAGYVVVTSWPGAQGRPAVVWPAGPRHRRRRAASTSHPERELSSRSQVS